MAKIAVGCVLLTGNSRAPHPITLNIICSRSVLWIFTHNYTNYWRANFWNQWHHQNEPQSTDSGNVPGLEATVESSRCQVPEWPLWVCWGTLGWLGQSGNLTLLLIISVKVAVTPRGWCCSNTDPCFNSRFLSSKVRCAEILSYKVYVCGRGGATTCCWPKSPFQAFRFLFTPIHQMLV